MHLIEIDDQVFAEVGFQAKKLNLTPNEVLRHNLNIPALSSNRNDRGQCDAHESANSVSSKSELTVFIKTNEVQRYDLAVDRFMAILGWLHTNHRDKFTAAVRQIKHPKRIYFATTKKAIEDSGEKVRAKSVPQSPFWVLVSNDTPSKRKVLAELLHLLNYIQTDINLACAELPDSKGRPRYDLSVYDAV